MKNMSRFCLFFLRIYQLLWLSLNPPQDNYLSTETHAERIPNTRVSSPLIKINMKDHPHVVS